MKKPHSPIYLKALLHLLIALFFLCSASFEPAFSSTADQPEKPCAFFANPNNIANAIRVSDFESHRLEKIIQLARVIVTNRSYEDYLLVLNKMGFDPSSQVGKKILDLGSGISSFGPTLRKMDADVYLVDIAFMPKFGEDNQIEIPRDALTSMDRPHITSDGSPMTNYELVAQWMKARPTFKQLFEEGRLVGSSVTDLPFSQQSVDTIVSFGSLWQVEHESFQRALVEILRALKMGGKAYLVDGGRAAQILNYWNIPFQKTPLDLRYQWDSKLFAPKHRPQPLEELIGQPIVDASYAITIEKTEDFLSNPNRFPIRMIQPDQIAWPSSKKETLNQLVYPLRDLLFALRAQNH